MTEFKEQFNILYYSVVFAMTTLLMVGRSVYELGTLRAKSSRHIAAKNFSLVAITSIIFFSVGFGLSQKSYGGLNGTSNYFLIGFEDKDYSKFLLDFTCCWHCVSIASASLCERAFLGTHVFLTVLISGILFPIVSAWVWGGGWLQELGFID